MLGLVIPQLASAHVKWFTDVDPVKEPIERILSPFFMIMALSVAVLLAILTQLLPAIMQIPLLRRFDRQVERLRPWSFRLLKYGTAAALLWQAVEGTLFAPEIELQGTWAVVFLWLAIALLLIPHHYASKAAAVVLLGLFVYSIRLAEHGWFHMLDYGFYVAIMAGLALQRTKWESWSFPLLYLGTGLSLCWVATEKWIYPKMALDVIEHHGVPTFGFAPELFIVMCAFIEFVVGYLLVVGILNRLLAIVLTGIFITTTMLFGYVEVVGHFMIHIILLIFIIEGVSFYKPPIEIHKTTVDRMVFVMLNFLFVVAAFLLIYFRFG
ncbi:hypothetical protein [Paenibacillus koleovorans]|uniref:hypothetical protein n=1 Tax=Paenibacillus koleovorans TaxID=121608 RepID=UPI001FE788E7|nr:hypothetical protein [Paenibacillus koleovorans]